MSKTVDKVKRSSDGRGWVGRFLVLCALVTANWAMAGQKTGVEAGPAGEDGCWYQVEYYSSGQVKSRVGFMTGQTGEPVLGCKTTVYYESGKVAMEQEFKNGLPHGIYRTFYENGQREMEYAYDMGTPDGPVTYWYENGKMKAQGTLHEGLKEGAWTTWHEDGSIESQGEYAQDRKVGTWFYQKADGVTTRVMDYTCGTETQ